MGQISQCDHRCCLWPAQEGASQRTKETFPGRVEAEQELLVPLCLAAAAPDRVELSSVRGRGGSRVSLVGANAAQDSAELSFAAVLRGPTRPWVRVFPSQCLSALARMRQPQENWSNSPRTSSISASCWASPRLTWGWRWARSTVRGRGRALAFPHSRWEGRGSGGVWNHLG